MAVLFKCCALLSLVVTLVANVAWAFQALGDDVENFVIHPETSFEDEEDDRNNTEEVKLILDDGKTTLDLQLGNLRTC